MTIQQQPLPLKVVMVWEGTGQIGDKWEKYFSVYILIFVDDENVIY